MYSTKPPNASLRLAGRCYDLGEVNHTLSLAAAHNLNRTGKAHPRVLGALSQLAKARVEVGQRFQAAHYRIAAPYERMPGREPAMSWL